MPQAEAGYAAADRRALRVDLSGIWFVGDSIGDLEAARAVDCQPVLVKTGKGVRTLGKPLPEGTLIFDDLAAVASALLQ